MCSSVAWWPKCRRGTAPRSDRARQGFEVLQRNSIGLIFIFCKRIPAQKDWSWTKMMAWPLFGVDPDVLFQHLSMEECVRLSGMVRAWSLWWDATQEKRRPNKKGGLLNCLLRVSGMIWVFGGLCTFSTKLLCFLASLFLTWSLMDWQTYRPSYFRVGSNLSAKRSQIRPGNPGLETIHSLHCCARGVSFQTPVPACCLTEFLAKMLQDWH